MTYTDDTRRYAKPYEEVEESVDVAVQAIRLVNRFDKARTFSEKDEAKIYAYVAIRKLRQLGFINDIGLTAIRAEEDEGKTE